MLFRVLGPLEVDADLDGEPISLAVAGPRPRALLTALLLEPNVVVPTHRLVDTLWPRRHPDNPTNALHQVVARLRAQLGPAGAAVVTRPPGYLLRIEPGELDAACFDVECRTARELRSTDPARAAELLDRALARWRGPAYGEFADELARAAATGLEDRRLAALEERAALELESGLVTAAVASAQDLVARHPLRERPVELLMRALQADGRTAEALAAYQHHRRMVADELGLDPTPALRDVEAAILRSDLDAPARAVPPVTGAEPARPMDLPWRPGRLLGRDQELDLLLDCLSAQRVITLVGPGGVGKTRLALEAAHHLVASGRPVWWLDLGPVAGPRVVDAIAEATRAEIPRSADPVASLARSLPAQGGVLCLDDAEHLLAELAPIVERLVDAASRLTVLATSRERLAVGPEHVHLLSPLPLPAGADRENPALRLFVERAPGLELDALGDDDAAAVAEVCRRLDGLPLAIELGAARAGTFGVGELAARLGDRLDLLTGGRRTAATRHRTLRAVVDWSHELLTGPEARLFARLAVFPSAFTLNRAEAVCADGRLPRSEVAPLLARLVEQSMVQARDGRFWLLETLRAYAAERLDVDESRTTRTRHAAVTADLLASLRARLTTADEAAAVAAIAALGPDLHAAWTYAAVEDRTLAVRLAADVYDYAYHRQRLDLLEWGRAAAGWVVAGWADDHPRMPDALATGAAAAWSAGRLDDAAHFAARAVQLAAGAPNGARAVVQEANLAMFAGRIDDAAEGFTRAAALFRAGGDHVRGLMCDISVAHAFNSGGRSPEATELVDDLVVRARATGNPTVLSWGLLVGADATADVDANRARAGYSAAIAHGSLVDNRLFVALARASAVALSTRHGDAAAALEAFDAILAQWEDSANEAVQWGTLLHLAELLARVGAERDGALVAGAVLAARRRRPTLPRDDARLADTIDRVRARIGGPSTEKALAEGADMALDAVVAHARQTIRVRRGLFEGSSPPGVR